jgi:hypothetical protein
MNRDNPSNVLGVNSANNCFDSSLVTGNADGSMIERQEYMQSLLAGITAGQVILQGAAAAGTNSKTAVAITVLAGYGDDFFNNQFYMQILKNANSAGNAPEKQTRKITDYVSATGTFTMDAFGAAVEASDICLILHESQVAVGSNNADNIFDSSTVAANADGSVLERLEAIKDQINTVDDYVDTEVAAIKAMTDKIGTVANTGGTAELGALLGDVKNIPLSASALDGIKQTTIADATTIPNNSQDAAGLLATATGGAIMIEEIIWNRGADNLVGPTNYEFSTDNALGMTGKDAPLGVAALVKFNETTSNVLSLDGATKQLPFILETGKKLYIHGDDAATSAGGTTTFTIKYKRLVAGAYLA